MTCQRCHGLMVFAPVVDEAAEVWTGYRCVQCGDYQDALILHHRAVPVPPEPKRVSGTPVYRGT